MDNKDDGNYVIPNQKSVVVGGTHQLDDWDKVFNLLSNFTLVIFYGLRLSNFLFWQSHITH